MIITLTRIPTRRFLIRKFSTNYELYQQTLQQHQEQIETEQRQQSEKMYQAWKRTEQKSAKSSGVAVVKTLVKEQRKPKSTLLFQQAQDYLQKAALEDKHTQAMVELANQKLKDEQIQEAIALYEQAQSPEALYNLGTIYWEGHFVPKNTHKAMQYFEQSVTQYQDPDAMYFVGVQNDNIELIQRAAAQGHGGALYYTALLKIDDDTAFQDALTQAIDAEYPEALNVRGHAHLNGEHGYTQDYRKALQDFITAAALGHADAAVTAGAILHQGLGGIERDQERAFELYQRAGELGSKEGWRNVVACYLTGEGVKESKETAKYIAETLLKEEN